MINSNKKVNEIKSSDLKKYKIVIGALGALLLCAVIAIVVLVSGNKGDDVIPINEALGSNKIAAAEVKNSDKESLILTLGEAIEDILGRNVYLNVQDGDSSFVTLIYNKNGESFAQASETGYITVYRNDHKAVRYTDYIDFGYDSDVLSLINNVYKMAKDGKAEILTNTEDDNIEGYTQIILDVRGWDRVAELYSMFDESFSKLMIEQLKSAVTEASASEDSGVSADDEVNFRFAFAISNSTKTLDSAGCYIYFGDIVSKNVTWDDLSASWAYNGYREVYDWELDEKWYTLDWESISEWEDTTEAETLLNTQFESVMGMLNQYAIDNGEKPILPSDSGTTTDNSSENNSGESSQPDQPQSGEDTTSGSTGESSSSDSESSSDSSDKNAEGNTTDESTENNE